MKSNVRRVTNDVISAVEDGFLSWEEVARACLDYMSEDDVEDMARSEEWAIADDDLFDEDVCPDCGKEFGKDGRCYNQDCVAYDPTSQYFDDEEDTIMNRLTISNFKQIDKIADRYNTSSPVSGNWDTEATHERDAIAKELGLTKEEANEVMVEYLGFDADDFESKKQSIEEEVDEDTLVENNYDNLDFHEEGLLIGDLPLEYTDLPVMNQFDNEIEVEYTFHVFVSPDMVLDFIYSQSDLNKQELTVKQAQEYIDELAKAPEDFYSYLQEYFVEEATEEAQQEVAGDGLH